jgi:hypothetical protein
MFVESVGLSMMVHVKPEMLFDLKHNSETIAFFLIVHSSALTFLAVAAFRVRPAIYTAEENRWCGRNGLWPRNK